MTDVADILDRAADLIEPEGAWTQGDYARIAGGDGWFDIGDGFTFCDFPAVSFCIYGAVSRAARMKNPRARRIPGQRLLIAAVNGSEPHHLSDWNDAPGRKQKEVVALLRKAAAKARGDQQ
jgi:hypothetical protein